MYILYEKQLTITCPVQKQYVLSDERWGWVICLDEKDPIWEGVCCDTTLWRSSKRDCCTTASRLQCPLGTKSQSFWKETSSWNSTNSKNKEITSFDDILPYFKGTRSLVSLDWNSKDMEVETCSKSNWRASHEIHFLGIGGNDAEETTRFGEGEGTTQRTRLRDGGDDTTRAGETTQHEERRNTSRGWGGNDAANRKKKRGGGARLPSWGAQGGSHGGRAPRVAFGAETQHTHSLKA